MIALRQLTNQKDLKSDSVSFHFISFEPRDFLFSPFLRSHLRTGAQRSNIHFAGSIPVLHFVTTFQVLRCAPPVLRFRYGRGNVFSTPMKADAQITTGDTAARCLLCESEATAIRRAATLRTSHKFGHPLVSQRPYQGEPVI